MKEVEGGKWGEDGLKVGHVFRSQGVLKVEGTMQVDRQTVIIVYILMYSQTITHQGEYHLVSHNDWPVRAKLVAQRLFSF